MTYARNRKATANRKPRRKPVTLKVLIESPDDNRQALAETLREVADDVEEGISNAIRGASADQLLFDFDITYGSLLDEMNSAVCELPSFAKAKVVPHRVGESKS